MLLDYQGRVAWHSPQATAWLEEAFGKTEEGRQATSEWLTFALREGEIGAGPARHGRLLARGLGRGGLGESMLLLQQASADELATQRLKDIALTPRETEVLSWVAKDKTNRDIADILGMSPRTVNKHLEHIFEKLGIETRSAASALATKLQM